MSGSYMRQLSAGVLPPLGLKWTVASRTVRGGGGTGLGQRHAAPAHLAARRPAQMQLDDRLRRPRGGLIGVRDLGPAPAVGRPGRGELGLGHRRRAAEIARRRLIIQRDLPALRIRPMDLGHNAPPRHGDPLGLVTRLEVVGLTAGDGEDFLPATIEALTVVGLDDEARPTIKRAVGLMRELRTDLVAGGAGDPAVGGCLSPARCRNGRGIRIRGRLVPAPTGQADPGQGQGPKNRHAFAPLAHRCLPYRMTLFVEHDPITPGYPSRAVTKQARSTLLDNHQ